MITNYSKEISNLSDKCLETAEFYKDYTNEDLMNATEIFMEVFMTKLWDKQKKDKLDISTRKSEATEAGNELRRFIQKWTEINLHRIYKK